MQNDEKCKNDNLLSDQVLVLLMFIIKWKRIRAVKIVFLVMCILQKDVEKTNSSG